jgi:hypothetical protein
MNNTYFKNNGSWDYGLDYKDTYKKLINDIKSIRKEFKQGNINTNKVKAFANLITGLIQLRNGSRIGEAVSAINNFINDFSKNITEVLVQKQKGNSKNYRKVILPEEITLNDLEYVKSYIEYRQGNKKNFIISLCRYFQEHYKFSTHALRYAWISFMALKNVPAQVIAKITGHKTLDILLHYTQKKIGENLLFNMFRKN